MNASMAQRLMQMPPVRAGFSLGALGLIGTITTHPEMDDLALTLVIIVVIVLFAALPWVWTLDGFLRDLRPPRRPDGAVLIAWRPRRAAVALSWVGLVAAVLGTVGFGALLGVEHSARFVAISGVAAAVGVIVATVLPRLSRAWSTSQGTVAICPGGLIVTGHGGRGSSQVLLEDLRRVRLDREVDRSLPAGAGNGLGPGVRWRPGAQEAIGRWSTEGFSPTFEETRRFGLEPAWSPDPRVDATPLLARLRQSVFYAWGSVLLAGFGGIFVWGIATGEAPWWLVVLFGWMPVVGLAVFLPRIFTSLRSAQPFAGATELGWFDILHRRRLIPWEQIDRIEVHARVVTVVLLPRAPRVLNFDRDRGDRPGRRRPAWSASVRTSIRVSRPAGTDELTYPPSTDTVSLATWAERHGCAQVTWKEEVR
ncbi:hypothetical protein CFK38_09970 [Brachybacterium vulturis]|uniref:Uncharacterized protein n=1 Tax=Brachybacterium vulturis TaxID=2017484 RepID=A0A291GP22_9MICO|nr:hypothetical protein [Brachybacterium vulturis]ATG51812.1 hypothetical protein CFK38_09970 [Brachybacterium vulturis]